MKWRGETERQWLDRTRRWHRVFLLFPEQMLDGTWVWLETAWARRVPTNVNRGWFWEYSQAVTALEEAA